MPKTPNAKISYNIVMKIPFERIQRSGLSYDHHGLNGSPRIDLRTRKRGYRPECLRPPEDHLRILEHKGVIGSKSLIVTQTHRNAYQNLRAPVYSAENGVCASLDEEVTKSQRPYYGIGHLADRTFAGRALDFRQPIPEDIRYWAAGIPVLWQGRLLSARDMAPEVPDACHLFSLDVSPHRGTNPEHVKIHDRLRAVFEATVHGPADEAATAIEAISAGLPREDAYLHNAVAAGPGYLMIVVAHGPLEYLGALAKTNGATHCCVIDNGGSVQVGIRRPRERLRAIAESYYFREPTIALAAYEICTESETEDYLPFDGMFGSSTGSEVMTTKR